MPSHSLNNTDHDGGEARNTTAPPSAATVAQSLGGTPSIAIPSAEQTLRPWSSLRTIVSAAKTPAETIACLSRREGAIRHCQLERENGQQCHYSFRRGQGAAFAAHVLCVHIAHELREKDTQMNTTQLVIDLSTKRRALECAWRCPYCTT